MVKKFPVGIIQGRLTRSADGRIQFFPKDNWRNEFPLASKIGFDCLEPILEADDYQSNPLLTESGIKDLVRLSELHGVKIFSVCADFMMDYRFHRTTIRKRKLAAEILNQLVVNCERIGVKTILIPVLERSAILTDVEKRELRNSLLPILEVAGKKRVRMAIEPSLPAPELKDFIESFDCSNVGVYYDIGNATAYGFDAAKEIRYLKDLVFGIHVKDRKVGGSTVILGTGGANFPEIFTALGDVGYNNHLILQAARDPQDNVARNAIRNLNFVNQFLNKPRP